MDRVRYDVALVVDEPAAGFTFSFVIDASPTAPSTG
jgi:hypothetical protein